MESISFFTHDILVLFQCFSVHNRGNLSLIFYANFCRPKSLAIMPQKPITHLLTDNKSVLRKRPSSVFSPSSTWSASKSKSTGLVYDDRMLQHRHEWFHGEQESPARIQRAYERCHEEGLISRCMLVPAKHVSEDSLALVHDRNYIRLIRRSRTFSRQELYNLSGQFDGVFFNEFTWNCASLAAGSLKSLTHLVAEGRLLNGLALIRPPGHHAMHAEACGYCIFNNVAVAVASLLNSPPNGITSCSIGSDLSFGSGRKSRKITVVPSNDDNDMRAFGHQTRSVKSSESSAVAISSKEEPDFTSGSPITMERILILDWDVHHGQGTQYAFYEDNRVLYVSIHRYEKGNFWPHLREANCDFVGHGPGRGYNVNIPVDQIDMTDADYLAVFHQLVMPIALEYNPQLVVVSCGFDAAIGCPEGRMWLTPALFGHFVNHLKILAGGKIVVALEGGYYVDSLSESAVHVLKALLGDPVTPVRLVRAPCKSIRKSIELCTTALRPYWKSLWIQDVSRIVDRPNLSHVPMISWPLVRRIVWPETNPLIPEPLARCVHELMNHGIAMPLPELEQQPYLLLVPFKLNAQSVNEPKMKTDRRNCGTTKQKCICPWPKKLLVRMSNFLHIHFYRETGSADQTTATDGKQSAPPSAAAATTTTLTDSGEISVHPAKRRCLTHSADHRSKSPGTDLNHSHTASSTVCGCSLSINRGVNKWISPDVSNSAPVLSAALEKSMTDLFLRRFIRTVLVGHELTPFELVNAIRQLPEQLLFTYRGRLLYSRMGRPLPNPVIFPSHNAIHHGRQYGDVSGGIGPVDQGESQTSGLDNPAVESFGLNANSCTDQIGSNSARPSSASNAYKSNESVQACRILVLDLTGSEDPGECGDLVKQSNVEGHIRSDLLWCSIYTASMADYLASSPSLLRVTQLFRSHHTSTRGPIHSAQWLRIPVINTNQLRPHMLGTKTVSGTDMLCPNLCAALLHFLLPIAYEYGPELVCLRLGPEWTDSGQNCMELALSHLLHLIRGLGCAMFISLGSTHPPSNSMMSNLLDPVSDSCQVSSQPESMIPTAKMQTVLRHMFRENSFRWKSLSFADSLPKWR
ncbi:Histone deacetylase 6/10 [Fasciola hepatica]|uniref:Histone deacetylase 6/10 n=1 Tax=Fasciola hepatica TaxID=6192 RepID=A0A4E0RK37_FASHE|nr:Histone deacetylase 6/10 [Fasciola hepatica]